MAEASTPASELNSSRKRPTMCEKCSKEKVAARVRMNGTKMWLCKPCALNAIETSDDAPVAVAEPPVEAPKKKGSFFSIRRKGSKAQSPSTTPNSSGRIEKAKNPKAVDSAKPASPRRARPDLCETCHSQPPSAQIRMGKPDRRILWLCRACAIDSSKSMKPKVEPQQPAKVRTISEERTDIVAVLSPRKDTQGDVVAILSPRKDAQGNDSPYVKITDIEPLSDDEDDEDNDTNESSVEPKNLSNIMEAAKSPRVQITSITPLDDTNNDASTSSNTNASTPNSSIANANNGADSVRCSAAGPLPATPVARDSTASAVGELPATPPQAKKKPMRVLSDADYEEDDGDLSSSMGSSLSSSISESTDSEEDSFNKHTSTDFVLGEEVFNAKNPRYTPIMWIWSKKRCYDILRHISNKEDNYTVWLTATSSKLLVQYLQAMLRRIVERQSRGLADYLPKMTFIDKPSNIELTVDRIFPIGARVLSVDQCNVEILYQMEAVWVKLRGDNLGTLRRGKKGGGARKKPPRRVIVKKEQ